jgi:hypothetical protein
VLEMLNDHRQSLAGTLAEAAERALWLLSDRPHLLVKEEYSRQYTPCKNAANTRHSDWRNPMRPLPFWVTGSQRPGDGCEA